MAGSRELIIQQGAQTVAGFLSSRIRARKTTVETTEVAEVDRPALKAAEELLGRNAQPTAPAGDIPLGIPADLFDDVEGREDVKALLERSLRSNQPVHVLLVGDPGCGKSQLLQCIAKLPNSRYAVGGATSSSGLLDYLLEKPNTRYLIIDELDKADQADLYALYSLMESGMVTRLQHNAQQQAKRTVWVFAAANSAEKIPEALASRFVRIEMANYSEEETRQITSTILQRREGMSAARAGEIAAATASRSRDPRDGIQVGRLAGAEGPIDGLVDQVVPAKSG